MYLMPYPCYSYDYIVPSPPASPSVGEESIASNTIESTDTNANHTSNNNHSSENVSWNFRSLLYDLFQISARRAK